MIDSRRRGRPSKLDQGYKSSRKASIDAMSELGGAIVSITLVMCPCLFL